MCCGINANYMHYDASIAMWTRKISKGGLFFETMQLQIYVVLCIVKTKSE